MWRAWILSAFAAAVASLGGAEPAKASDPVQSSPSPVARDDGAPISSLLGCDWQLPHADAHG